jgi:hypothetical protein
MGIVTGPRGWAGRELNTLPGGDAGLIEKPTNLYDNQSENPQYRLSGSSLTHESPHLLKIQKTPLKTA